MPGAVRGRRNPRTEQRIPQPESNEVRGPTAGHVWQGCCFMLLYHDARTGTPDGGAEDTRGPSQDLRLEVGVVQHAAAGVGLRKFDSGAG
jgi:hypothetical protein